MMRTAKRAWGAIAILVAVGCTPGVRWNSNDYRPEDRIHGTAVALTGLVLTKAYQQDKVSLPAGFFQVRPPMRDGFAAYTGGYISYPSIWGGSECPVGIAVDMTNVLNNRVFYMNSNCIGPEVTHLPIQIVNVRTGEIIAEAGK